MAAKVLNMHMAVNDIYNCITLQNPEERRAYLEAVHLAVTTLASGLGSGSQEDIGAPVADRQRNIARDGSALSKKISEAIKTIGGDVGPNPHYGGPNNIGDGLFKGPKGPRMSHLH